MKLLVILDGAPFLPVGLDFLIRNRIAQAVIEKESGDKLLEWGAKLFYFDRRKCIQVVNFASKFTLFLIDMENLKQ